MRNIMIYLVAIIVGYVLMTLIATPLLALGFKVTAGIIAFLMGWLAILAAAAMVRKIRKWEEDHGKDDQGVG